MKREYTTPKYIICKSPLKDGTFHDHRTWVYATQALSLIEFINTDEMKDFEFKNFKYFNYTNEEGKIESWIAVFTQNNCEFTEVNKEEILKEAWDIFQKYLKQIGENEGEHLKMLTNEEIEEIENKTQELLEKINKIRTTTIIGDKNVSTSIKYFNSRLNEVDMFIQTMRINGYFGKSPHQKELLEEQMKIVEQLNQIKIFVEKVYKEYKI